MKLNNKGFLITGILYSLLLLFLVLIVGMVAILNARQKKIDYISKDIISTLEDKYNFNVARSWSFNYTGNYQVFTVPTDGYYEIELWGASGGSNEKTVENTSGRGAYTKGTIYLNKGENIYIYVGGKVTNTKDANGYYDTEGGYNGGGPGESAGGGATDIRLTSGNWNDFNSLKSRIMVAAGGGGGVYKSTYAGTQRGDGGTLNGIDANFSVTTYGYGYSGHGATQTAGGKPGEKFSGGVDPTETSSMTGKFGIGGYSTTANGRYTYASSGGGGGYYGGGHGNHPGNSWSGAGGGSSFISGYYGCDAIAESSTESKIVHTGKPIHYSGKIFYNAIMIDGAGSMPSYDGSTKMTGNAGNGYAKISLLNSANNSDVIKSFTIDKVLVQKNYESEGITVPTNIDSITVPAKVFDDGIWMNVYYHNSKNGTVLFSNANNWFEARNTNSENKRSILFTLVNNNFKIGNKYELLLQYPDESEITRNRWLQTYSPIDSAGTVANGTGSEVVPGYEPKHIDWNTNYWGGLALSTVSACYINGSIGHSNWFYAIGPSTVHQNGVPSTSAVTSGISVTKGRVELWVRIDDYFKK